MSIKYFYNLAFNMNIIRYYFAQDLTYKYKKIFLNKLCEFIINFGVIIAYKFVQIHMDTPNIVCYIFS
jgi:hypothetical protein